MKQEFNVWTIGHSTRSLAEFIELLRTNEIEVLADVRRFPASRKYPHFNGDKLQESLAPTISYEHFPELGGRRRPRPHSSNDIWRNESFRGYADYMETPDFEAGVARLLNIARLKRSALMCSEAVWWRCHRSLIADYLKTEGITVLHILAINKTEVHPYTSAARLVDGDLSYAAGEGEAANEKSRVADS